MAADFRRSLQSKEERDRSRKEKVPVEEVKLRRRVPRANVKGL